MKKFMIRINRQSVRRNPDAGATSTHIPGIVHEELDDQGRVISMHRDTQTVRWLTPSPNFLFEYQDSSVTCDACGQSFSYKELQSHSVGVDADGDDEIADNVCPHCGEPDCCLTDYEKLTDAELALLVPKPVENPIPKFNTSRPFAQVLSDFRAKGSHTAEDYGELLFAFALNVKSGRLVWQDAWDLIVKEFKPKV